ERPGFMLRSPWFCPIVGLLCQFGFQFGQLLWQALRHGPARVQLALLVDAPVRRVPEPQDVAPQLQLPGRLWPIRIHAHHHLEEVPGPGRVELLGLRPPALLPQAAQVGVARCRHPVFAGGVGEVCGIVADVAVQVGIPGVEAQRRLVEEAPPYRLSPRTTIGCGPCRCGHGEIPPYRLRALLALVLPDTSSPSSPKMLGCPASYASTRSRLPRAVAASCSLQLTR